MSYTPTTWQTGDTITAALLNKMEQGIANAGGGGLVVQITMTEDGYLLDKTWLEIYNAARTGNVALITISPDGDYDDIKQTLLQDIYAYEGVYTVLAADLEYTTDSPNGYPSFLFEP